MSGQTVPIQEGTVSPLANIAVEIISDGSNNVMPVSKIHTGATGIDGGPVTSSNPLPVYDINLSLVLSVLNGLNTLLTNGINVNVTDEPSNLATNTTVSAITTAINSLITLLPTSLTSSGNLKVAIEEGSLTLNSLPAGTANIGSVNAVQSGSWSTSISGTVPVSGTFYQATQPVSLSSLPSVTLVTGQNINAVQSGTWNVNISNSSLPVTLSSIPLATGAATETGNLLNINNKLTNDSNGNLKVNNSAQTFSYSVNNSTNGNSTAYNLISGTTWNGTIESAINQPYIITSILSNQPVTITFYQFLDILGTLPDSPPVIFNVTPGVPFCQPITVFGDNCQIVVTNNSGNTATIYVDTYYGSLPPFPISLTQSGNFRTAISEFDPLLQDSFNGNQYLYVDPSNGATDGSIYNNINVPQVGMMAGRGIDGLVHSVSVDNFGYINVKDNSIPLSQNNYTPLFVAVTGDPSGDFAGVNLLEQVMDTGSTLGFNVNQLNKPKSDIQNAQVNSDAPSPININLANTQSIIIDTTGYNTLSITTFALTGTVTTSNDPTLNFVATTVLTPSVLANSTVALSLAANNTYIIPVSARYIKITATSVGTATAYLRNISSFVNSSDLISLGGTALVSTAVAGTLPVGGITNVGATPTILPVLVGGRDTSLNSRFLQTDINGKILVAGTDSVSATHPILTDTVGRTVVASTDQIGNTQKLGAITTSLFNLASLAVQDLTVTEGLTQTELLVLILQELRISNFYNLELPNVLNKGIGHLDSPEALRADSTLFPTNL
jgi:hypothetical protein